VRGASRLALAFGISPLVVGLTVVAFGTSAPELAVTVGASYAGQPDLALGNIVGSNIFNLLLVLGASAAVAPLIVQHQLVRLDVPLMIGVSLVMAGMSLDGRIDRIDGGFLFSGIIAYISFLIWQSRREPAAVQAEYEHAVEEKAPSRTRVPANLVLMLAGLGMLVLGARWLVAAASGIAQSLGVSELVIGLTIIAGGTSLPEVATSVIASLRGERDIAVGNVIGSNIFNLLVVLGLGSLVAPNGIPVPPGALTFDIPVMIAASIGILPIFFSNFMIARWEGFMLVGYYVAYTVFLVLEAAEHPALHEFGIAMRYFVFPLTAVTLAVVMVRGIRRARRNRPIEP